jgi:hypothetical protein
VRERVASSQVGLSFLGLHYSSGTLAPYMARACPAATEAVMIITFRGCGASYSQETLQKNDVGLRKVSGEWLRAWFACAQKRQADQLLILCLIFKQIS